MTLPAVMPLVSVRWNRIKNTMQGRIPSSADALDVVASMLCCPCSTAIASGAQIHGSTYTVRNTALPGNPRASKSARTPMSPMPSPAKRRRLGASMRITAAIVKTAKQTQRIDNGIEAQRKVLAVPAAEWARIHQSLLEKDLLTPKEDGVLRVAMQIPSKLPTEKQSVVLLDILDKGRLEGVVVSEP